MGQRRLWLGGAALVTVVVLIALRFDLVSDLRGPAPYPPEWQWAYRPHAWAKAWPALPLAAAWVALLLASGSGLAQRRPRAAAATLLLAASILGFVFPMALLESEDGGMVAHLVRRTASTTYLSYHAVACSIVARDPRAFLRDYPDLLPALPMHAATHPPGPVLFFRGLIGGLESHPGLGGLLDGAVTQACGPADCGATVAGLDVAERSAALAGAWISHGAAVATLFPIAWIAFALTRDRLAAARVAALWPLVPGAALFLPALDPPLALPVVSAIAFLRHAVAGERSWGRVMAAFGAGVAGAVAVFFSYGAASFLILGAGVALASLPPALWVEKRGRVVTGVLLTAAVGAGLVAAPMLVGHDPLESARTALEIHGQTYTARRSYALWLAYGPLDLMLFAGLPLVIGMAVHLGRAVRGWRTGTALTPPARWAAASLLAFALLFGSGLVRGEVGRILAPWLPLVLIAGLLRLEEEPGPDATTSAVAAALLALSDVVLRLTWRL